MRRPPYGVSVMRGLLLVWKKMTLNLLHGYVPSWWSEQDRHDVARAMKWLGDFIDWVDDKKEAEDGSVELADESRGADTEKQGQDSPKGLGETSQGESRDDAAVQAASAAGRFDPAFILAGRNRSLPT